jgi:hypothetical protein
LVQNLWDDFFRGIRPEQISTDLAEKFIDRVKGNQEINRLTREILRRGGVTASKWTKFCKAGKVAPIVGPLLFILDEFFLGARELNTLD